MNNRALSCCSRLHLFCSENAADRECAGAAVRSPHISDADARLCPRAAAGLLNFTVIRSAAGHGRQQLPMRRASCEPVRTLDRLLYRTGSCNKFDYCHARTASPWFSINLCDLVQFLGDRSPYAIAPLYVCPVLSVTLVGWMDQDATWCGCTCRSRPRPRCVRWGPSSPRKGEQLSTFRRMSVSAATAELLFFGPTPTVD